MDTLARKKTNPSLLVKLMAACNGLPALLKNGHRPDYDYLDVVELADAVQEEFSKAGLILIPNDLEFHESTSGSGDVFVKTEFTLTDGSHSQTWVGLGSGRSAEGHALHIAQTVALKSWLKRLTLLFGEEDNAEEAVDRKPQTAGTQRSRWEVAVNRSGKTAEQIRAYFAVAFNVTYDGSADVTALDSTEFNRAMKWLANNGDLAETLEMSKKAVEAKKTPISIAAGKPPAPQLVIDPNLDDEAVKQ